MTSRLRRLHHSISKLNLKSLLIVLVLLLIGIVTLWRITSFNSKKVAAAWWDDGWQYRQALNIATHNTLESNVYITVSINIGSTSKAQIDDGDFRFLNQNSEPLQYYIFSGAGTTNPTFHILLDSFPAGPQTLYAYYGNPSASNGFSAADFATQATNYSLSGNSAEEVGGGPTAYWKFDEGIGTSVFDSTVDKNNGLLQSPYPTWTLEDQCITGKCLLWGGSSSGILVPDNSYLKPNTLTISGWVKSVESKNQYIINKGDGSGSGAGYNVYIYSDNKIAFWFYNGAGNLVNINTGAGSVILNQWHFFTATYDGTNSRIYLDGVLKNTSTNTSGFTQKNQAITIGNAFHGFIDDLKIYPYARTSAQIAGDYQTGLSSQSSSKGSGVVMGSSSQKNLSDGLVGYWRFDESSGNSTDYSGNGNNAIPNGTDNYTSAGKFGNANRAGVGSTNIIPNPSFEFNATGYTGSPNTWFLSIWPGSGTGTMGQTNADYIFGNNSLRITNNDGVNQVFASTGVNMTVGTTYTYSCWVKSPTTAANIDIYNGTSWYASYVPAGKLNQWTRLTTTFVATATSTNPRIGIYPYGGGAANTAVYDGCQLEPLSTASPYLDGSLGTGTYWTGAAHNSISYRTFGYSYAPTSTSLNITSKTISYGAWVYLKDYPDSTNIGTIIQKGGWTDGYRLMINNAGKIWVGIGESQGGNLISNSVIPLNTWTHLFMTYDGQKIEAFINGNLNASIGYTGSLVSTAANVSFGGQEYPPITGYTDEARIYNRTLSDTEVLQLYNYSPPPLSYWKFDEAVGSTAYDTSTSGNHITLAAGASAPSWSPGKYGRSLNFTSGDYSYTKNGVNLNSDFTLSFWAKGAETAGWRWFLNMGNYGSGATGALTITTQGNKIRWSYGAWFTEGVTSTTTILDNTSWYYLTIGRSGNQLFTYINGRSEGVGGTTYISNLPTNVSINFGRGPNYGTDVFNGSIDEVRLYNYALTAKQIITDMNAGNPLSASKTPVAYYKFDEGYGNSTKSSIPGNNAIALQTCPSGSAPAWVDGKFSKAIQFSGSGYPSCNLGQLAYQSWMDTKELTVSFWMNPNNVAQLAYLPSRYVASASNIAWAILQNGQNIRLAVSPDGTVASRQFFNGSSNSLVANTWQHIAVTHTPGVGFKVYVNGSLKDTHPYTGNIFSNTTNLCMGTDCGSNSIYNGALDELKIYNYVLSADDIKKDYNQSSSLVMGQSTQSVGATTFNLDYCLPGDTSFCAPPTAEWKFDEGTGSTAYDTSGNNTSASLAPGTSAPSWAVGKIGRSLSFDGANDWLDGGTYSSLRSVNQTIEMWIKPKTYVNPLSSYVEAIRQEGSSGFHFSHTGGTWFLGVKNTGGSQYQIPVNDTNVPLNVWTHLTMTFDGATVSAYTNGILAGTAPFVGSRDTSNTNKIFIGTYGSGTGGPSLDRWFNGLIDQVRIYNYARTPAQIAYDYNKGAPILWWKLDECQGAKAFDSSGLGVTSAISIGPSGTQINLGTCQTGTSAAWTNGAQGKYNGSLNFDGIDDYALSSSVSYLTPVSGVTVSAWVYNQESRASRIPISAGNYQSYGWYWWLGNNYWNISLNVGGTSTIAQSNYSVGLNSWHHLVSVIDNPNLKTYFYVDGKLVATANNPNAYAAGSGKMSFGDYSPFQGGYNWTGKLDDIKIFPYLLTATQVKTLYNNGAVSFGN